MTTAKKSPAKPAPKKRSVPASASPQMPDRLQLFANDHWAIRFAVFVIDTVPLTIKAVPWPLSVAATMLLLWKIVPGVF